MKMNTSIFVRKINFLNRFSKTSIMKNKEFKDRVSKLVYYIDNMENVGYKTLDASKVNNTFVDVKRS